MMSRVSHHMLPRAEMNRIGIQDCNLLTYSSYKVYGSDEGEGDDTTNTASNSNNVDNIE